MRTEYVDETWGTVSARTDLDGTTSVTLEFNRHPDTEEDDGRVEFVMDVKLAREVAKRINAAVRMLK